jgi:hypothetical protein
VGILNVFFVLTESVLPHKVDVEKQNFFIAHYEVLKETVNDDESIETTGSRIRLNIVGAIRLGHLGEAVIEQYEKTVNGESIIEYFTKVRKFY